MRSDLRTTSPRLSPMNGNLILRKVKTMMTKQNVIEWNAKEIEEEEKQKIFEILYGKPETVEEKPCGMGKGDYHKPVKLTILPAEVIA